MKNVLSQEDFFYNRLFESWDLLNEEYSAEFDYKSGTATFLTPQGAETIFNSVPNVNPNSIDTDHLRTILGDKLYSSVTDQVSKISRAGGISGFVQKVIKFFAKKQSVLYAILLVVAMNISFPKTNDIVKALPIDTTIKTTILHWLGEYETEHIDTPAVKKTDDLQTFLDKIGFKESSSDHTKINSLGYIGKYQFGGMALKDLGLDHIKVSDFRANPDKVFPLAKQDAAMKKYLKLNAKYLGDYMDYIGHTIGNKWKITKSGLLAASHLVGAKKVKEFIDSDGKVIPKDGNGTPLTEYLMNYGGYDINSLWEDDPQS